MSNVSREKSFTFGCVIRFTLQCSSSRLSGTSGQLQNRRSLSRCCAETRRSRILVLDRHARRLQQLHQAVAVAAELFGQRLRRSHRLRRGNPLTWEDRHLHSEGRELRLKK